jgi:hypothetical protein
VTTWEESELAGLDDALLERLLDGDPIVGATHLADLVTALRADVHGPPPDPSPELARILVEGLPPVAGAGGAVPTAGVSSLRQRSSLRRVALTVLTSKLGLVTIGLTGAVASVGVGGAAGILPPRANDAVRAAITSVSGIEFADDEVLDIPAAPDDTPARGETSHGPPEDAQAGEPDAMPPDGPNPPWSPLPGADQLPPASDHRPVDPAQAPPVGAGPGAGPPSVGSAADSTGERPSGPRPDPGQRHEVPQPAPAERDADRDADPGPRQPGAPPPAGEGRHEEAPARGPGEQGEPSIHRLGNRLMGAHLQVLARSTGGARFATTARSPLRHGCARARTWRRARPTT